MRKLFTLGIILALASASLPTQAGTIQARPLTFTITGEIVGLVPGDTLVFEKIELPFRYGNSETAFEVIVTEPDRFNYTGSHDHTQYYMMKYKPLSGEKQDVSRTAMAVIVEEGAINITGSTDHIYFCSRSGGVYDDPGLNKMLTLEDSLEIARSTLLIKRKEAYDAGNKEEATEYVNQFNSFSITNKEAYQRLREAKKAFTENQPSSDWTIIEMLNKACYTPVDKLTAFYDKTDEKARDGYYGKLLKKEIDLIAALTPGSDAPEFTLTTLDGSRINSRDYSGSYILIYHWGLCPGSIMIDKEITAFYQKYKDNLVIIGITDSIEAIRGVNENTKPGDKMMNVELKPVLENMLAHPWPDAESKGDNKKVGLDFAFGGLPYFVFISPDGKILQRGFHEACQKAKETIVAQFGEK